MISKETYSRRDVLILFGSGAAALVAGCSGEDSLGKYPQIVRTPLLESLAEESDFPELTSLPSESPTPQPTASPLPTSTRIPTYTPEPTNTAQLHNIQAAETPMYVQTATPEPPMIEPRRENVELHLYERSLIDLTNSARAASGMSQLSTDAFLVQIARIRCQQLISSQIFAHDADKSGIDDFVELINGRGANYSLIGENLARNNYSYDKAVTSSHNSLLNSPTHAANIFERKFSRIGVGYGFDNVNSMHYFAQIFLG